MSQHAPENLEPQPSDVMEVLKQMGYSEESTAPPLTKEQTEDPLAALNFNEHDPALAERIPIPASALEDIAPPEKDRLLRKNDEAPAVVNPWIRKVRELGTVGVTDEEKDEYQRSLLFEERFEITVELALGNRSVYVRVRSLYESEKQVIALSVQHATANHPLKSINDVALGTSHYFKAVILTQVVSVDGKSFPIFDARTAHGQLPEDSPKVEELGRRIRTDFGEMHQAKFKMLMRAIHLFEIKQTILEDAVGNRDFYQPADTN